MATNDSILDSLTNQANGTPPLNLVQPDRLHTFNRIYGLATGQKRIDAIDRLSFQLGHLSAVLALGASDQAFANQNDGVRAGYLGACALVAGECIDLVAFVAVDDGSRSHVVETDELAARLKQLWAMLTIVIGAGEKSFLCYNDKIQETYLQACARTALECSALFKVQS